MRGMHVYAAINAITQALSGSGVGKHHVNDDEGYRFRSIDDVMSVLAPLLGRHKLCVLPRLIERTAEERRSRAGEPLRLVTVRVAYELVSIKDASKHIIEACGEAIDGGDKGTSKAMSAAYKYAMVQAFCIPVAGAPDADRSTKRLNTPVHEQEPVQGWDQWTADVGDVAKSCETTDALDRLMQSKRTLLLSLSRERPDLYALLGKVIATRKQELTTRKKPAGEAVAAGPARKPRRNAQSTPGTAASLELA